MFAHKSFDAHPVAEAFLLFFGVLATENSVLRWANDHRIHHAYVDSEKDPYSIKKGFWYAHMFWIFEVSHPVDSQLVRDLLSNKLVMLQHKYYTLVFVVQNAFCWLFFGWLFHDFMGAFVILVLGRLLLIHHLTWLINSAAHTWGSKQFSKEHSAVNNAALALFTFGEGYHNFHHTFPSDYRNGVYWYQIDPAKWIIWSGSKLRMFFNLKKMQNYTVKTRIIREEKEILFDRIKKSYSVKKEAWNTAIAELSDRMHAHANHIHKLYGDYRELKRIKADKKEMKKIKSLLKQQNKNLKQDWKVWCGLFSTVMQISSV